MKIKGAIFDMDGTLVDSLAFWGEFWREFGIRYMGKDGYFPPDEVNNAIKTMVYSQGVKYIYKACALTVSAAEFVEFSEYMIESFYKNKATVKAGAVELLEHLKMLGVPMCVASATDLKYVKVAIRSTGLEGYFDNVLSCEQVGKGKDSPEIYYEAAKVLGTEIADTCVFEDSCVALETAQRAGFKTVGVYDKHNFGHDRLKKASQLYVDRDENLLKIIPEIK